MHDNLYDFVCGELEDLDKKAKNGKLSMQEIEYIDTLEHIKKSMLTNDAMEESGYSGTYPYAYGSYDDGMNRNGRENSSYRGGSYARGRNAKRDSMGRYSRYDGYSRHGYFAEDLRTLMQDAPNDQIRMEIQRLADKVEQA